MSTGLSCLFVEPKPGTWYYVLEHGSAPQNAWDWREFASAYGPFTSEYAALVHLRENHANPGGWGVTAHKDFRTNATYEKLFREALL